MADYDIITVGGGIGGSSIAKAMAENGKKVLVLEREKAFKDRVRGEWTAPWGVDEIQKLGLYDDLVAAGAYPAPKFAGYAGPAPLPLRNFPEDCAMKLPALTMYHPAMQAAVIEAAAKAGAEVRRGVKVSKVTPGEEPHVEWEQDRKTQTAKARLVVGADGRNSMTRKWGGFESREEEGGNQLAGVLIENYSGLDDTATGVFNPFMGQIALIFPQGGGKARAYFGTRIDKAERLQGDGDFQKLVEMSVQTGAPAALYEGVRQAGPVATFPGYDSWVEHPYKDGIALVGDAAQTSDQTWGQGLSITFKDARLLRDALLSTDDWDAAGHKYAEAANWSFEQVRLVEEWQTQVMMDQSEEANAIRSTVLPRMMTGQAALPETHFAGPDLAPADEAARKGLFGE
jgi:2-polyprenyl-6-methoxyphenol hydroxylase-like FAD-dependent oxidoreductase